MARPGPVGKGLRLSAALLAVGWSVFPIAMVVLSSFKPQREIFAIPPSPTFSPTLENYRRLLEEWPAFFPNMLNSVLVTAGAALLTVVLSTLAGYVYARFRGCVLALSAFFMVVVRMVPPSVVALPLFPLFS